MAENKHFEISNILEKSIRSGKYFERIPPVRVLAREFKVSLQTMSKALKTLQNAGLIISGPGGTRIVEKIPYSFSGGVVSVFMPADKKAFIRLENDDLWLTLQEEADKDKVTLVAMQASDEEIFSKQKFWESRHSDGFIFLYSSFYPIAGVHLRIADIPFVAGNWLPPEFKAHWVDFDWKKRLFELVRLLQEKGFSRIAYLPNLHWKFGVDYHFDMWRDVCDSYGIVNYSPRPRSFGGNFKSAFERILQSRNDVPEVLLMTNIDPEELSCMLDEFQYHGKVLVSDTYRDLCHDSRLIFYNSYDYRQLGKKIWQVFKQVANGSVGACFEHFVTPDKEVLYMDNQ